MKNIGKHGICVLAACGFVWGLWVAFWLLFAFAARADRVQVSWDDPNRPGQVETFFVYFGDQPSLYTNAAAVPGAETNYVTPQLPPGHYYFAVSASNAFGESELSDEAAIELPADKHIHLVGYLESADEVTGPWTSRHTWPELDIPFSDRQQFFRIKIVMEVPH